MGWGGREGRSIPKGLEKASFGDKCVVSEQGKEKRRRRRQGEYEHRWGGGSKWGGVGGWVGGSKWGEGGGERRVNRRGAPAPAGRGPPRAGVARMQKGRGAGGRGQERC